ncbi:hypothetical protein LJB42_001993 [Komagataella kurtzmanii]|nr:hypothetical protein LJB42_001993 [Komagataella kurtzmanii]
MMMLLVVYQLVVLVLGLESVSEGKLASLLDLGDWDLANSSLSISDFIKLKLKGQKTYHKFDEHVFAAMARIQSNENGKLADYESTSSKTDVTIQNVELWKKLSEEEYTYEPRITLAVYLSYIHQRTYDRYATSYAPYNLQVPFSWADWIDLTALNQYLDKTRGCEAVFPRESEATMKLNNITVVDWLEGLCITDKSLQNSVNSTYAEEINSRDILSPNFHVFGYSDAKDNPQQKIFQSKSYINSKLPLPKSLIFLTDGGSYALTVDRTQNKRIVKSGLLSHFFSKKKKEHNLPQDQKTFTFDPVYEFNRLKSQVKPRPISSEPSIDSILKENDYKLKLKESSFIFNYGRILSNYEDRLESLNDFEKSHYESLAYSSLLEARKLPKYFGEVILKNPQDGGIHYDYRFFSGLIDKTQINHFEDETERKKIIMHRLLRTWQYFTYHNNIINWISHGSLLSWYWDGLSFPWDNDIDVQMPIMELNNFCKQFNNSLVVEDVSQGFGRYYVDCTSFLAQRTRGNGNNNIDARFIDVSSGLFIDITGLALTGSTMPKRYSNKLIKQPKKITDSTGSTPENGLTRNLRQNLNAQVYNCRNGHFYQYSELSPLKLSIVEGALTLIPNDFVTILETEYQRRGLEKNTYAKYLYVPELRLWMSYNDIYDILQGTNSHGRPLSAKTMATIFPRLNSDINLKKFLRNDHTFKNIYSTFNVTRVHEEELKYLIVNYDQNKRKSAEYRQFLENLRFMNPIRKDLVTYESRLKALDGYNEVEELEKKRENREKERKEKKKKEEKEKKDKEEREKKDKEEKEKKEKKEKEEKERKEKEEKEEYEEDDNEGEQPTEQKIQQEAKE